MKVASILSSFVGAAMQFNFAGSCGHCGALFPIKNGFWDERPIWDSRALFTFPKFWRVLDKLEAKPFPNIFAPAFPPIIAFAPILPISRFIAGLLFGCLIFAN